MRESLAEDWRKNGVDDGDTLLVHSSLKRTVRRYREQGIQLSIEDLLTSFLDAVGDRGTVLFPLFNFEFAKGVAFDIRRTPSQMGALTEAARHHRAAVRTSHPIYSFAVIGRHAIQFGQLNNESGYGPDSPFALLTQLDGKIGVLNLDDQNSMTYYHYVEESLGVPYRYFKKFTADYTDGVGQERERTYSLFVRDLDRGIVTHVNPMSERLWQAGHYKGDRFDTGTGFRVIRARDLFEATAAVIRSGEAEGLLYRIEQP